MVAPVIGHQALDGQVDLADQHAVRIRIHHRPHLTDHLMNVRLVGRIDLQVAIDVRLVRLPRWIGRVVAELLILNQQPKHVDTDAINTSIQPESHRVPHREAHLGISPV